MLDTKESTDVDFQLIVLEELFAEECKCEFKHTKTTCSTEVTHRVSQCTYSVNVCSVGAEQASLNMASPNLHCMGCKNRAGECWSIVKI